MLEELVKMCKSFEMTATTSVGLSRKNWLDSLKTHFAYPNKDAALLKLYKEVIEEVRVALNVFYGDAGTLIVSFWISRLSHKANSVRHCLKCATL